ncbi:MAG: hypothetical protein K0S26_1716 [Bacteroidota bacterium]|jgi:GT2 family glycosyltransferase|nr:hypothetical protein [Bacteroidota bacterium]
MKVFVVIVTYNGAKWLDQCIGYTLKSTVKPEVIVIDNNSSDSTPDIIEQKFREVKLIKSKENSGFGKSNNMGMKMAYEAGADYILLLNQDAWLETDTLEKLIQSHKVQNDFDLISPMHLNGEGNALDYNFSNYIAPEFCKNLYSDIYVGKIEQKLYEAQFINAACWLLTRKCLETIGGFSPVFYHYGEDNNYVDRLHYHGLKLGVCPQAKAFHDRDQINSGAFYKKEVLEMRRRTLKYSDPNNVSSINAEIKQKASFAWRAKLKLKLGEAKKLTQQKKDLLALSELTAESLEKSKKKGLTFLD